MIHSNIDQSADRIDIVYYTDPLCCWSFGFEREWQQLKETLGIDLNVRYCMSGMLESWGSYNDELNSVTKPIQMGPLWMQASHVCGVPIDGSIWVEDPPASSYLACVAVKCAFHQSFSIGEKYLEHLRIAVMQKGINIALQSNLMSLAREIDEMDYKQFVFDLLSGIGIQLFNIDLGEVRHRNITRFPTLLISNKNKAILLTGYRKYGVLINAIENLIANHAQTG
jgi:predicted DsbA family dithiol-disulfide isomerase